MPMGLGRLEGGAPGPAGSARLIPWAWGINGFASVLAAPLALALAMTWGYHVVVVLALLLYLLAGFLFVGLDPGQGTRGATGATGAGSLDR